MRRTGRWTTGAGAVVIVAAMAAAPPVMGQGRAGGAPMQGGPGAAPATGTGILAGRVLEAGGTTPVAGAVVRISGPALGNAGGPFAAASGAGPRSVQVNGSGQFLFTGLPKGAFSIDVTAPGYMPGAYGQERPRSAIPRALDTVRQLDLGDGEVKPNITVHMWRLGAITGTVTDEYGQPVVGIDVHVQAVQEIWIGRISANADTATTDDRGIYRAEVAPGDYIVGVGSATTTVPAAMIDDYWSSVSDQTSFRAAMDQFNANGLSIPAQSGQRIGDVVVSSSGSTGFPPRLNPWFWTDGDTGPSFVYPATYYPSVSLSTAASIIAVEAGAERSGIDLQLKPQRAFRISGRLLGPNGPVPGLGVRLIGADFNTKTSSPSLFTPVAATDATGAFTFMGISPGQYTLDAIKTPAVSRAGTTISVTTGNGGMSMTTFANNNAAPVTEPVLWASQPVAVGNGDVTDVTMTLTEGARISGRFDFSASSSALTPDQLHAIRVSLRVQPGTTAGRLSGNPQLGTAVDDAGGFRTSEVVPGPYILVVNALPPNWFLRSAMYNGKDISDAPVEIGASGLSDVVLTLTNKTTTLTGAVTGDDNTPPPGQPASPPTVVVFSTNQNLWPKVALSPRTLRSIAVSATLTYRTIGLPAGEYYVAASSSSADFTDPKVLLFLSKGAVRVTLVEGESRAQDVRAVVVPAVK